MDNIRTAVFDVDGTLFDYREHRIPDSTVASIRELKKRGVLVIVATARSYAELSDDLLSKIEADYYVAASGQCIQDSQGRALFSDHFTYEQAERVKNLAMKYDVGLTLKYEKMNCIYSHPLEMQQIFSNIGNPRCPSLYCTSMDEHSRQLPIGFAIRGENGLRDLVCDELGRFPNEYRMELFKNGMVADIYSPFINKMTALEYLMKRLQVDPQNCIAFGDGKNDIEMIRWAGTGIAMGNACEELRKVADVVCGATWEDGISNYLHSLFQD